MEAKLHDVQSGKGHSEETVTARAENSTKAQRHEIPLSSTKKGRARWWAYAVGSGDTCTRGVRLAAGHLSLERARMHISYLTAYGNSPDTVMRSEVKEWALIRTGPPQALVS